MQEVTIKLGGREFVVPRPMMRAEARWRQQAEQALAPFWDAAKMQQLDINKPDDLGKLISQAAALLDPMPALDAVCAYAPQLAAERDWIEENCYSEEAMGALVGLFFGQLRQLEQLSQTLNGSLPKPT